MCFVPDIVPDPSNIGETKMKMVRLYSVDDLATFAPKSLGVLSPPTQQSSILIENREDGTLRARLILLYAYSNF
jgi:hypothetical protein